MTCRELLQSIKNQLDAESNIRESEIQMTSVFADGAACVARILVPLEGNRTRIIEIRTKELCVYEGLNAPEHRVS